MAVLGGWAASYERGTPVQVSYMPAVSALMDLPAIRDLSDPSLPPVSLSPSLSLIHTHSFSPSPSLSLSLTHTHAQPAVEREGNNLKHVRDFRLKNGSSQGQNMALTG